MLTKEIFSSLKLYMVNCLFITKNNQSLPIQYFEADFVKIMLTSFVQHMVLFGLILYVPFNIF